MFPTSLEHPYAPRGRRRGRNDPNSRDYICPCGKSYLSYPALFTHIKIKHNGRAPGQIIKPKSENPSKRGRPRQKQVYDSDSDTNDIAANCIDRLCDFVTEFDKPQQSLCSKLKDLYMKDAFYRVYVNYNPQQQEPRYNEREDLYEEYSDNVFCELIAEVNKRLNEPYHIDSVIVMLMLLGHFVNDNNVVVENAVEKRREEDMDYEDDGYGQNEQEYDNQIENNQQIAEQQQYHSSSQEEHNYKNNHQQQKVEQQHKPQSDNLLPQNEQQKIVRNPSNPQQVNLQQDQYEQQHEEVQQLEPNNQDTLMKLGHQPIRNIVNYINDFIINYQSKYFNTYHLEQYPFFLQNNAKIFLQLFFNWLTMKKYVAYKVKINQHYE